MEELSDDRACCNRWLGAQRILYGGCAVADGDYEIDIIDRLPTPFGLIRAGVAPDHQKTKNVSRAYAKTALNEKVAYFGNVDIGKDVSVDELQSLYDAVVLAIGSPYDRKLGVPGEDKRGVFGSADFVGWYNGHPDFRDLEPDLDTDAVVVIGVGNVAIDCARVLVKTPDEMSDTDIATHAADAIQASPLKDVYMIGRRGPIDAKFTNVELREMGELKNCTPIINGSVIPDEVPEDMKMSDRDRRLKDRNLGTLKVSSMQRRKNARSSPFPVLCVAGGSPRRRLRRRDSNGDQRG